MVSQAFFGPHKISVNHLREFAVERVVEKSLSVFPQALTLGPAPNGWGKILDPDWNEG